MGLGANMDRQQHGNDGADGKVSRIDSISLDPLPMPLKARRGCRA